jgi:Tol biopolymer transport system component
MSFSVGTRLGPYEILAPIGAGGMGEVYRARDARLKRDVALKVLPEVFANDAERMSRFQREAEVLASLNHPNIAHVYGVEERALVIEMVEGESPKGPMPFEDAWKIVMQMADALEYAHEKGVIHRDLKPANVKVTPEGVVKLLDFGLAKALSPDSGELVAEGHPTDSPTLTMGATLAGVILGTAAYMSPEQAKGKRVDRRADIWSWGVVLFELLTGERMFQGDDVADTLAAVIHKQPDLERVPAKVRRLLAECLQKDPRLRLRDIGDAKRLLEAEPASIALSRFRLVWALAAAVLVVSAALGSVAWKHFHEEPPRVVKLFFPLPERETFQPGSPPATAISPDGRRIAFEAVVDGKGELWVRDLDNSAPHILAVGASGMPFWAPDSRRLGFFADGKLRKIDVTGGPAVTIADAQATTGGRGPWNGSWNRDDVIVFGRITSPLFRVSAAGSSPAPLTNLDENRHETAHFAPWFLPDGDHFLYVALSTEADKTGIYVADLASKTRKHVTIGNARTIYVAPGYFLFVRDGTLLAQPFDTGKLETTGDAVPVAEQVDANTAGVGVTIGYFSASQNGVLVYTSGRELAGVQLTWFDGAGRKLETVGAPGQLSSFSLSPDGTRVAFLRRDPQVGRYDLWTRDLARGAESRLTSNGVASGPVWSADGTYIFYGSRPFGKIYQKAANNTGAEEVVDVSAKLPMNASREGRYLFTTTSGNTPKTGLDIWVLPLFGDRKPFPYVQTEYQENQPRLSPDGSWLAYRSNESKRNEIYVVSFPQPGGKWQISTNGGQSPIWSHDGRKLYYYGLDNKIMAVDIKPPAPGSPQLQFGVPRALFEVRLSTVGDASFDVSKDGRFLVPAYVGQQVSTPMTVVLNWPQILKAK